jgi:hypothetical protein
MKLHEYASLDGLDLVELVAKRQVPRRSSREPRPEAIAAANPAIGAVVETYPDRIEGDEPSCRCQ